MSIAPEAVRFCTAHLQVGTLAAEQRMPPNAGKKTKSVSFRGARLPAGRHSDEESLFDGKKGEILRFACPSGRRAQNDGAKLFSALDERDRCRTNLATHNPMALTIRTETRHGGF
jgi:hypothetical protein